MSGKHIVSASLLLVFASLLLFLAPGSGVRAHNWDTAYEVILSNETADAPTDQTTIYQISVIDNNFSAIYSTTGDPYASIALDSEIEDGSSIGSISSQTTLSIFNGPCNTPLTVNIPFMDCTADTLDLMPWVGSGDNLVQDNDNDMNEDGTAAPNHDGNCIDGVDNDGNGDIDGADPECNQDGSGPGEEDGCPAGTCYDGIDNGPLCDGAGGDGADALDTDCQEVKDTNGIPSYCDHYPSYLNNMFSGIRPRARFMGHSVVVAGAPASLLNFVIFNPAALAGQPGVVGELGDTYGFLDFVVLDDPTGTVSPSTVTDFCTPLASVPTLLGTTDGSYTVMPGPEPYEVDAAGECGDATDNDTDGWVDDGCLVFSGAGPYYEARQNASPLTGLLGTGTHPIRSYSMSQRDADGDGVSNNFDGCPLCFNIGDSDGDGLDDCCDPFPATPSPGAPAACAATSGIADEDQDCYPNRQDICPLVPDGDPYAPVPSGNQQTDTDTSPGFAPADFGPGVDAIGDACEDGDWDGDKITGEPEDRIRGEDCDDPGDPLYPCEDDATECNDMVDDDADTVADDGCIPSSTFPNGHFHVALPIAYICIPDPLGGDDYDNDGNSDDDNDEVCDSTEVLLGSDPEDADSMPENIVLDLDIATGTPAQGPGSCSNYGVYNHPDAPAIDDDGDTLINVGEGGVWGNCADTVDNDGDTDIDAADSECADGEDPDCAPIAGDADNDGVPDGTDNCMNDENGDQVDSDGDTVGDECDTDDDNDGVSDVNENSMGTDPKDNAADSSKDDANPFDFNNDTVVDVTDAGTFLGKFPSAVTNPGDARYDYNRDGVVDVTDNGTFLGKFPSDTKNPIILTNNTGQAVNDVYIEFFSAITKVASASGGWGPTGAVTPPSSSIDLSGGDLANGGTLTLTLVGKRPPVVRCYDWTKDGVVINGSPKPCRYHNDTGDVVNDIHIEYSSPVLADEVIWWINDVKIWCDWWIKWWVLKVDIVFGIDAADSSVVHDRQIRPGVPWDLDCWYWTKDGSQVGPTYGTCDP